MGTHKVVLARSAFRRSHGPASATRRTGPRPVDERGGRLDPATLVVHLGITPREAEVLIWIARGKTNADVARILGISPKTIAKHVQQIFTKLGVETRTAAAVRVLTMGAAAVQAPHDSSAPRTE